MDESTGMITVSCANHHEALVNGLWNSLTSQLGVDFDFRWGGRAIRVHRLIVDLFLTPDKLDCPPEVPLTDQPEIKIDEIDNNQPQDVDLNLDYVLAFIYTGKITVRPEHLDRLLDAARRLEFRLLEDAVVSSQTGAENEQDIKITIDVPEVVADGLPAPIRRGRRRRKTNPEVPDMLDDEEDGRMTPEPKRISDPDCPTKIRKSGSGRKTKNSVKNASPGSATGSGRRGRPKLSQAVIRTVLRCDQCDYGTRYKTLFQHHRAKHDSSIEVFRCLTCSRPFLNDAALQRHLDARTCKTRIFECPHCDYKNVNKHSFRLHVTRHDPNLPFFRCESCSVPFLDEPALERHMLKHAGSPAIYTCIHCGFVTPKFRGFRHHLINLHGVDENNLPVDKKFKCTECSNSYVYESELKYHVTTRHCSARPFKCDQCDFCSSRKADVGKHVKIAHLGIKKYMCEECGFRAVTPYNLERHKVSHTGLKPFSCTVCGLSYGDRGSLKRHVDRHVTDEKKFVCHLCGHSTRRRDHLKKHLKNVHKSLETT